VIKEYVESNTGVSSKDLEKGISIILLYLKLRMVKINDIEVEKNKIKMIPKICLKDNNVVVAT